MSTSTPLITSTSFPTGERVYNARYVDGLKWSEMRAHFKVSARSSRFLQEAVAYVNGNAELLERHPEMAYLEADADGFREAVKAARTAGQGFSVLQARTGLKPADLRKLVGEEVGTTARVAYGQRYSGKLAATTEEATEEAATEAAKPARKSRAKKTADADLTAALEASVKAAPKRKRAAKKVAA